MAPLCLRPDTSERMTPVNALFRASVERMPFAVLYLDGEGEVVYANPQARSLLKLSTGSGPALRIGDIQPSFVLPESGPGRANGTTTIIDSFGSEILVDATIEPVPVDGAAWWCVTYQDRSPVLDLERRLEVARSRLRSLKSIDLAIGASTELNETLEVILDHVTEQLVVDAAGILLCDPERRRLEFAAARGFRTEALKYTSLPIGSSYAGRAAEERRIVRIERMNAAVAFAESPLLQEEDFASYIAMPLVAKGTVNGVLELFTRTEFSPGEGWIDSATAIAQQTAIAVDNASLLSDLKHSNDDLSLAYETTLDGWSRALDLRDRETEGHSRRVAALSMRLSKALGMSKHELIHLRRGALLHDIGKMGVPDHILLKPGPLDEDEWVVMRKHAEYAKDLLEPIRYLRPAIEIPYCHHEWWDGSGYPQRLSGTSIPLSARVFAVVDVWDALTSGRPYRAAWSVEDAAAHIAAGKGTHFDPALVQPFLKLISHTGD